MIKIKIVYNDSESVDIDIDTDELNDLHTCLVSGKIYWNKKNHMGFWAPMKEIRYAQFFRINDKITALEEENPELVYKAEPVELDS